MPIPVTQGILQFMKAQLNINAWEVEVPLYDARGLPINPQQNVTNPTSWPVVTAVIEGRFTRAWNMGTDPYDDTGTVVISVHGLTKAQVQAAYDPIEALWATQLKWQQVAFNPPGDNSNPFYVIQMLLTEWWLGQVEGIRLAGELLYFRGDLVYGKCQVHGAINTTQ